LPSPATRRVGTAVSSTQACIIGHANAEVVLRAVGGII